MNLPFSFQPKRGPEGRRRTPAAALQPQALPSHRPRGTSRGPLVRGGKGQSQRGIKRGCFQTAPRAHLLGQLLRAVALRPPPRAAGETAASVPGASFLTKTQRRFLSNLSSDRRRPLANSQVLEDASDNPAQCSHCCQGRGCGGPAPPSARAPAPALRPAQTHGHRSLPRKIPFPGAASSDITSKPLT